MAQLPEAKDGEDADIPLHQGQEDDHEDRCQSVQKQKAPGLQPEEAPRHGHPLNPEDDDAGYAQEKRKQDQPADERLSGLDATQEVIPRHRGEEPQGEEQEQIVDGEPRDDKDPGRGAGQGGVEGEGPGHAEIGRHDRGEDAGARRPHLYGEHLTDPCGRDDEDDALPRRPAARLPGRDLQPQRQDQDEEENDDHLSDGEGVLRVALQPQQAGRLGRHHIPALDDDVAQHQAAFDDGDPLLRALSHQLGELRLDLVVGVVHLRQQLIDQVGVVHRTDALPDLVPQQGRLRSPALQDVAGREVRKIGVPDLRGQLYDSAPLRSVHGKHGVQQGRRHIGQELRVLGVLYRLELLQAFFHPVPGGDVPDHDAGHPLLHHLPKGPRGRAVLVLHRGDDPVGLGGRQPLREAVAPVADVEPLHHDDGEPDGQQHDYGEEIGPAPFRGYGGPGATRPVKKGAFHSGHRPGPLSGRSRDGRRRPL